MAGKALPPPEVLRQLFRYDPETGKLFWRHRDASVFSAGGRTSAEHAARTWNTKYANREAFTARKKSGHLYGRLFRAYTMAHRVAWAIHFGEAPNGFIDHINHDPADNRIKNLRVVDAAENAKNRSPNKGKRSGLPHGVSVRVNGGINRYFAQIQVGGANNYLGTFNTPDEASDAYRKAAAENGFHENHAILRAKEAGQ